LVDFYEIQYEGHAIEVTSTPYFLIPYLQPFQKADVQTSEVDAKLAPFHVGPWNFAYDRYSKDKQLLEKTIFVKNKKYEHGARLNVKIHGLFCGDNSWTVVLRQMNFSIVRDHEHIYKFYLNHYFVWRSFY
jgi:hypothetical protein